MTLYRERDERVKISQEENDLFQIHTLKADTVLPYLTICLALKELENKNLTLLKREGGI